LQHGSDWKEASLEFNFGSPVLSGFVALDQRFGSFDNVSRGKTQLTHDNLTGRRPTEAIQPDDCAVEAGAPSESVAWL